jgi:SAM-dependent MidA family methyltransferase
MQMKQLIYSTIKTNGPISLETYMDMCLYDSNFGYYTTKEHIFGSQGDFITAPEVSSMFGESIAVFIYKVLESWGFPKKFDVVEIGAGRGVLAKDVLKGLININIIDGCNMNIIEKSQKLIKIQQETVNGMLLKKKIFADYNFDEVYIIFYFRKIK